MDTSKLAWVALVAATATCTPDRSIERSEPPTGAAAALVTRVHSTFVREVAGQRLPVLRPPEVTGPGIAVTLPSRADGWLAVRDEASGLGVRGRLLGASGASPRAVSGYRVFADALPSASVIHRLSRHGAEDWVMFERSPEAESLRYSIELDPNVSGLRLVAGVLELVDSGGAPRIRIGPAVVFDSEARSERAALRVEGCPADERPSAPWGRPPVAPGSARCTVVVDWSGLGLRYPLLVDPPWETTGSMSVERTSFAMTTLDDGLVLASGGFDAQGTAELYDATTGTWASTGDTNAERFSHTQTLLDDGRVLAVAGGSTVGAATTAELYDPILGQWSLCGSLATARRQHTATRLADGRVLIAGGIPPAATAGLTESEIFDPDSNQFVVAPSMANPRYGARAHELPDGSVLVVGGEHHGAAQSSCERYHPGFDAWAPAPSLGLARASFTMSLLPSGHSVVAGGDDYGTSSVEVLDPQGLGWSPGPPLHAPRADHVAEVLPDGRLLVAGGQIDAGLSLDSVEILDHADASEWIEVMPLTNTRHGARSAALDDGSVLVAGGFEQSFGLATAERFTLLANGEPCAASGDCASASCVEGLCCDAPCDGLCMACAASTTGAPDGTCAPVTASTDPDDECLDDGAATCGQNGLCDGAGACDAYERAAGGCAPQPCASDANCSSGVCDPDEGICCDTDCSAPCMTCSSAKKSEGPDGVCGFVAAGTAPDGDCEIGETCAATHYCDGAGQCAPSEALCAPYVCGGSLGCLTSCTDTSQCQAPSSCNDVGQCTGACLDEVTASSAEGPIACAPYRCVIEEGGCLTSCESVDDCAPGSVCTESQVCAEAPGAVDDSGCGCRIAGNASSRAPFGALLIAIVMALTRRRTRSEARSGAQRTRATCR